MARACVLLLFYTVLVILAVQDYRNRKISDECHVILLVLALTAIPVIPEVSMGARVLGMLAVSVPMTVLAFVFPGSFGGGDVKLVFAGGAFLGVHLVMRGTSLGIFLAGIYSLWLILIKNERKNVQFAFGPYLCIGFLISSFSLF